MKQLSLTAVLLCACHSTSLTGRADADVDAPPAVDVTIDPDVPLDAMADPVIDAADDPVIDGGILDAPPGDAAFIPIGPPVEIDDSTLDGSEPSVAWNGTEWGITWEGWHEHRFRALDASATPLLPPVLVRIPGAVRAMKWREDRYTIVSYIYGAGSYVTSLDSRGTVLDGPTMVADGSQHPDLTWCDDTGAWAMGVAMEDERTGDLMRIDAMMIGTDTTLLAGPEVVYSMSTNGGTRILSSAGSIDILWSVGGQIWLESFPWPDAPDPPDPVRINARPLFRNTAFDVDRMDGNIIVIGLSGYDVSSFTLRADGTISGPMTVGSSEVQEYPPAVIGAPGRGFLGVCYQQGPAPEGGTWGDGFAFNLVSSEGLPLGEELVLSEDVRHACRCDIGWSGDEFLVLYSHCAGGPESNELLAQRIRPLI